MDEFLHQLSMWIIFLGALALLYIAYVWFQKDNLLMASGMSLMGLIALSNFYLHRRMMKKKPNSLN